MGVSDTLLAPGKGVDGFFSKDKTSASEEGS